MIHAHAVVVKNIRSVVANRGDDKLLVYERSLNELKPLREVLSKLKESL